MHFAVILSKRNRLQVRLQQSNHSVTSAWLEQSHFMKKRAKEDGVG
jgi:hypothetical protein